MHMIRQCVIPINKLLNGVCISLAKEKKKSYLMEYEQDADRGKLTSIALGLPIAHRFTL